MASAFDNRQPARVSAVLARWRWTFEVFAEGDCPTLAACGRTGNAIRDEQERLCGHCLRRGWHPMFDRGPGAEGVGPA